MKLFTRWWFFPPLLGFVPLWVALFQPSAEPRRQSFFYDPVIPDVNFGADRNVTISPSQVVRLGEEWEQSYELQTDGVNRFFHAAQIGIELANPEEVQSVQAATFQLEFPAGFARSLIFQARSQEKNSSFLVFDRASETKTSDFSSMRDVGGAIARLSFRSATDARIHLKAVYADKEPVSRQLYGPCKHPSGPVGVGSISGWMEPDKDCSLKISKIALLAHLWGLETKTLVGLILASVFLWGGGCFFLVRSLGTAVNTLHPIAWPLSAGSIFAGLAFCYAVIIPPLQAPDEASHLLTATALGKLPDNQQKVTLLAQRTHFERIKFRVFEKFSATDLEAPLVQGLSVHNGIIHQSRSPLSNTVWLMMRQPLLQLDSGHALFFLRLCNGFFLSSFLLLGLWIFHRYSPKPPGLWLLAPFLMVPAVLFFGTALSNYPFLMGGIFLQVLAFSLLWQSLNTGAKVEIPYEAAWLAGLGTGVAMSSGDGGFISLLWWSFLLPGWCLAAGGSGTNPLALLKKAVWMGGLFGGASLTVGLLVAWGNGGGGFLSPRLQSYFSLWKVPLVQSCSPILFGLLVIGVFSVALMMIVFVFLWIRNQLPQKILFSAGLGLAGAMLLILIFGALGIHRPRLPNHQDLPVGTFPLNSLLHSLGASFLNGFFFPKPDWYTVRYFWGYFGWLETPLPTLLTDSLRYFFGIGLVLLPGLIFCRPALRFQAWLWSASWLAILGSLAVIGIMGLMTANQVHGRYLIGPYLLTMTLSVQGYQHLASWWEGSQRFRQFSAAGILTAISLVHGVALAAVLERYF